MRQVNEAIEHVVAHGGAANLQGWYYDLVLDRLEKIGFRRKSGSQFPWGMEGSLYENDSGAKVQVLTNRLQGPMTVIKSTPSPEKPTPKG